MLKLSQIDFLTKLLPVFLAMRLITKVSLLVSTFALLACADVKNDTDRDNLDDGSTGGQVGLGGASTGGSSTGGGGTIGAGNSTSSGGAAATGGTSTGGGSSTGGASTGGASTGGASTGGSASGGSASGGSSGSCVADITCGTNGGTPPSPGTAGACYNIKNNALGWQVSNADGCAITLNGSAITAGATLSSGKLAFSGCTLTYVSWSCW